MEGLWANNIISKKEYRNLARVHTTISKIFYTVINRLEQQLSQLVNIYRNEEDLSYQPLANSYISNSIDLIQDSYCFENQDLILEHPIELDQHQILENHIDMLASYPFSEIELEHEYDPNLKLVIQFHFLIQ